MFDQIDGALDQIEGVVGDADLGLGGNNVLLDPAPEVNGFIGTIFAAIIELFSILRNLMKI